jgi:hypothetical protein
MFNMINIKTIRFLIIELYIILRGSASSIIVGTVVGAECGGPYGALAGFGTSLLFNAGEQGYNTMAPIYRDNVSKWNTAVNNPGEIQSRFTGVPMQFINGFGF